MTPTSTHTQTLVLAALLGGVVLGGIATLSLDVFADGDPATDNAPQRIPYQGTLEFDGQPVNAIGQAAIPMRFSIYDGPEAEAPVYQQDLNVEVFGGRFTAILGPTDIDGVQIATVVAGADPLQLGITLLNGPGEEDDIILSNRQEILATPYAMWATSSTNLAVGNDANIGRNLTVGNNISAGNDITATRTVNAGDDVNAAADVIAGGAIRPSAGDSGHGIDFPNHIGGGSGDGAWIRYLDQGGESTRLQIGIENDPADDIEFHQDGSARMRIDNNVNVLTNMSISGNLSVSGQMRVPAASDRLDDSKVGIELQRMENCSGQRGRLVVRRVGNDNDDALCICLDGGSRHGNRERWYCIEPD
ncbi:MAG: hypothetical protein AAFS10_12940 [Myxococcota bacterium]